MDNIFPLMHILYSSVTAYYYQLSFLCGLLCIVNVMVIFCRCTGPFWDNKVFILIPKSSTSIMAVVPGYPKNIIDICYLFKSLFNGFQIQPNVNPFFVWMISKPLSYNKPGTKRLFWWQSEQFCFSRKRNCSQRSPSGMK